MAGLLYKRVYIRQVREEGREEREEREKWEDRENLVCGWGLETCSEPDACLCWECLFKKGTINAVLEYRCRLALCKVIFKIHP